MAGDYQWVGWALSGAILSIVGTMQIVLPAIRRRRMRRPFSAYFREAGFHERSAKPTTLTVRAHAEAHIQINRVVKVTHTEHELIVGFEGGGEDRPELLGVENKFVARGKARSADPSTRESHYGHLEQWQFSADIVF